MPGTPIRLTMRGQGDKNPYKGRKKKNAGALRKHKRSLQSKQGGEKL
jgi:GTP-binding protein